MLTRRDQTQLSFSSYFTVAAVFLCLLTLYLPWGTLFHTGIAVAETLGWGLFGVTMLVISCSSLAFYRSWLLFTAVIALLLPVLWMSVQADIWRTFPRVIAMVLGVVIVCRFGALKLTDAQLHNIGKGIIYPGLACSLSVFIRHFWPAGHAVWLPMAGGGWATGGFLQSDLMATFLATTLLVALHTGLRYRNYRMLPCIAVFSFSLMLCQSMVGLLVFFIPFLMMCFACSRECREYLAEGFLVIAIATATGACWLYFTGYTPIVKTFAGTAYWHNLKAAFALWHQHPLVGIGYGQLQSALPRGINAAGLSGNTYRTVVVDHISPEPFYWVTEGGILPLFGMALLIIWFFRLFSQVWHQARRVGGYGHNGSDALGWGICAIPLLLHTLVGMPWYYSPLHYLLFLILTGMVLAGSSESERKSHRLTGLWLSLRTVFFIAGIGIAWYSITSTMVADGVQEARQNNAMNISRMQTAARLNPWAVPDTVAFTRSMNQLQMYRQTEDLSFLKGVDENFSRYIQRHPDPNVYSLLITTLDLQNKESEAERVYNKAHEDFPDDPRFIADSDSKK